MATLTDTANFFRRFLVIGGLVLASYFILSFGFGLLINLFTPGRKIPVIQAEVRFGKLPALNFGANNQPPKEGDAVYTLETVSGGFPAVPGILPVFSVTLPRVSLLVTQRATDTALRLGFDKEPQTLSPIDYLWTRPDRLQTLRMNILTGNFRLSPVPEAVTVFPPGKLPSPESIIPNARNWISTSRALDKSFPENGTVVTLYKINNRQLVRAAGYSEAEVARADLFREVTYNKNTYQLMTIKPQESLLYLFIGGGRGEPYVIASTIWNYDLEKGTTYPIKPPASAWKELRAGLGAVVALTKDDLTSYPPERIPEITAVTIRDVSLAYFDEEIMQNYLQPVYVFSGQANLKSGERLAVVIYVSAVDAAWVVK